MRTVTVSQCNMSAPVQWFDWGGNCTGRCLQEEKVDYVFAIPGGAVLFIYDALFQQEKVLPHILVRHEQAAISRGRCLRALDGNRRRRLATSGLVTTPSPASPRPTATSIPMVTSACRPPPSARTPFPGSRHRGHHAPLCQTQLPRQGPGDIAATMKKVFHLAAPAGPGPVLVDIPWDVSAQSAEYPKEKSVDGRTTRWSKAIRARSRSLQAASSQAPDDLHGGGGVERCPTSLRLPGASWATRSPTPDGFGGYPCHRLPIPGMPGITAPTKPTWRWILPTCCSPSAPASTTA